MMLFWLAAAMMILVALAFVLWPLGKRRRGTGTAEAGGRSVGVIVALCAVPVVAVGMYLGLGSLEAVDASRAPPATGEGPQTSAADPHAGAGSAGAGHDVEGMVSKLEARLRADPEDGEGWTLLGRTYGYMNRHTDAVAALTQARRIRGDVAPLLADLAEATAHANGNRVDDEVMKLIGSALEKEPGNQKALWLAGVGHIQAGRRPEAIRAWQELLAQLPKEAPEAATLDGYIAQVRRGELPGAAPASTAAVAEGGTAAITVAVSVDPAVAAAVSPDDTVFVFARAASGPKMPLAIVRRAGRDLPFQVELNESQAMAPGMSIAKFPEVIVGARISKSGDATAKPGDIEGMSVPVPVRGGPPVAVRIATVVGQEAGR